MTGREDGTGLIKPMAYVVARAGVAPGAELAAELQQFARARLAEYKRPRWIEFVDALPTTATGKIQRFKLRGAMREEPTCHRSRGQQGAALACKSPEHRPPLHRVQLDREELRPQCTIAAGHPPTLASLVDVCS